ncbi:MAG TPA: GNAT family N-acetyltransferase [Gemmatimonadales bacterium]|nr:GNAT family N-acetyltransferase [Gemmatimonadales bacterium]
MPSSRVSLGAPTLRTARLLLGRFEPEDAAELQRLASAREIADTTLSIPHPYALDHARAWIANQRRESVRGRATNFAVRLSPGSTLIGSIGLRDIDPEHLQAELGFWIGREWWGQGYASEAAREMIRFGFDELGLNRIYAHHMVRNPAAGHVLRHAGMQREGLLRERVRKWGVFEDVVLYAILREERN